MTKRGSNAPHTIQYKDLTNMDTQEYLKELQYKLEDPNLSEEEREEIIQHLNICRAQYLDYCLNKLTGA